jgi:hypothetical protein
LFTRLASPEAELLTAGDEDALGLGLGLGLAVADAFGEPVAEAVGLGLGVALAATSGTILAEVLAVLVALAVGVGVAVAPGLVLIPGPVVADALGLGDGLGVAAGAGVALYGSKSSTWRNSSRAFALTNWIVCAEPWPGTVTTRRLGPCGCTWAPELPVPLTRDSMTAMAAFISCDEGIPPLGVLACMVTWVPLERSSPRPTLNLCGHAEGLNRVVPRIPSSIATSSISRTISARPGCGTVLLGGATSLPVCDQSSLIPAGARNTLVLVGSGQVIVAGAVVLFL